MSDRKKLKIHTSLTTRRVFLDDIEISSYVSGIEISEDTSKPTYVLLRLVPGIRIEYQYPKDKE